MTRTEKAEEIKKMIENCVAKINHDERDAYRAIAEYAVELGYMPKQVLRSGKKSNDLDFKKSKIKRKLMQMRANDTNLKLKLVFYAAQDYEKFIKPEIRFYGEGSIPCCGCGKCKGEPQVYTYTLPDGRAAFRCGGELVHMWDLNATEHVDEIKAMIKAQDEFWVGKIEK